MRGIQGGPAEALEPGGVLPRRGGEFAGGEGAVGGEGEEAAEVAEAGEAGDEVDVEGAAVGVEVAEVVGGVGVGGGVAGDVGVESESERMFKIELDGCSK